MVFVWEKTLPYSLQKRSQIVQKKKLYKHQIQIYERSDLEFDRERNERVNVPVLQKIVSNGTSKATFDGICNSSSRPSSFTSNIFSSCLNNYYIVLSSDQVNDNIWIIKTLFMFISSDMSLGVKN